MNISFTCSGCGAEQVVPTQQAGQRIKCGQCGAVVRVPVPRGLRPSQGAGGPPAASGASSADGASSRAAGPARSSRPSQAGGPPPGRARSQPASEAPSQFGSGVSGPVLPITCPGCGKSLRVPVRYAGKVIRCRCGCMLPVPARTPAAGAGEPETAEPKTSLEALGLDEGPDSALEAEPATTITRTRHRAKRTGPPIAVAVAAGVGAAAIVLLVAVGLWLSLRGAGGGGTQKTGTETATETATRPPAVQPPASEPHPAAASRSVLDYLPADVPAAAGLHLDGSFNSLAPACRGYVQSTVQPVLAAAGMSMEQVADLLWATVGPDSAPLIAVRYLQPVDQAGLRERLACRQTPESPADVKLYTLPAAGEGWRLCFPDERTVLAGHKMAVTAAATQASRRPGGRADEAARSHTLLRAVLTAVAANHGPEQQPLNRSTGEPRPGQQPSSSVGQQGRVGSGYVWFLMKPGPWQQATAGWLDPAVTDERWRQAAQGTRSVVLCLAFGEAITLRLDLECASRSASQAIGSKLTSVAGQLVKLAAGYGDLPGVARVSSRPGSSAGSAPAGAPAAGPQPPSGKQSAATEPGAARLEGLAKLWRKAELGTEQTAVHLRLPPVAADQAEARFLLELMPLAAQAAFGADSPGVGPYPGPQRRLARALARLLDRDGAFPAGSYKPKGEKEPEVLKRISWMAGLLPFIGRQDVYDRINFEKPFTDGENQRVAYVVIEAFLDPRVASRRWQGYPFDGLALTHFVGMAGLGPDAARLPKDDPRAGIFGYDRATTLDDITDGTGQTILILQAHDLFGPWIQAGGSTVRGAQRPPYIGSIGGFGSPGRDGVLAVFADGSVRLLSRDMDPKVFEALCTMHGGERPGQDIGPVAQPGANK